MKQLILLGLGLTTFTSMSAFAWQGPVCFPSTTKEVVLTIKDGNFKQKPEISYEDNDGFIGDRELELTEVRASASTAKATDYVFRHRTHDRMGYGITGVIFKSCDDDRMYFEFEFRDNGDCVGATISAK